MGILATTRAFGDTDLKQFGVIAEPEITSVRRCPGDELLILATDGVSNVLTNEEVGDVATRVVRRALQRGASRSAAIRMAASAIGRFSRDRNSKDDITVIVMDLTTQPETEQQPQPPPPPPPQQQQQPAFQQQQQQQQQQQLQTLHQQQQMQQQCREPHRQQLPREQPPQQQSGMPPWAGCAPCPAGPGLQAAEPLPPPPPSAPTQPPHHVTPLPCLGGAGSCSHVTPWHHPPGCHAAAVGAQAAASQPADAFARSGWPVWQAQSQAELQPPQPRPLPPQPRPPQLRCDGSSPRSAASSPGADALAGGRLWSREDTTPPPQPPAAAMPSAAATEWGTQSAAAAAAAEGRADASTTATTAAAAMSPFHYWHGTMEHLPSVCDPVVTPSLPPPPLAFLPGAPDTGRPHPVSSTPPLGEPAACISPPPAGALLESAGCAAALMAPSAAPRPAGSLTAAAAAAVPRHGAGAVVAPTCGAAPRPRPASWGEPRLALSAMKAAALEASDEGRDGGDGGRDGGGEGGGSGGGKGRSSAPAAVLAATLQDWAASVLVARHSTRSLSETSVGPEQR